MLSGNVRVAVIRMTNVMHTNLIASPSALPEPAFGIADSINNEWQQRRPYLGVFTYETRRSAEHVVGVGVAIPGKMSADYERRVAVSDFTAAKPPVSIGRLRRRLGRKYEHAVNAGPAASDESAQQLITALRTVAPHLAQPLEALIETLGGYVADSEIRTVRTHEKDGVNLLLRANGFAFLASIGYQLADIEQAVADETVYTADTPPNDGLAADVDGESGDRDGAESIGTGIDVAGHAFGDAPDRSPDTALRAADEASA